MRRSRSSKEARVTRRGYRQRPWTVKDELFLATRAGTVPPEEIAHELGRTLHSLDNKLRRMNAGHGTRATLACPGTVAVCPACGHTTAIGLDAHGTCPTCRETARGGRYHEALRAAEIAHARVLETRRIEAARVKGLIDLNNAIKMRKMRLTKKTRAASQASTQ